MQQLQQDEEGLHRVTDTYLYAEATLAARASVRVRKQVIEFNMRLVEATGYECNLPPVFFDCVDSQGVRVSAARAARLFFTERAHQAPPTPVDPAHNPVAHQSIQCHLDLCGYYAG
jgi:hypothetical protein